MLIHFFKKWHKQKGAVTLILTLVLLLATAYVAIFVARSSVSQQRLIANQYRSAQALEAAEAGLNFGLAYLIQNKNTIVVDSNSDGYIDNFSNSSTTNVTLSNGSTYSITYSNPTANNFNIIKITSVGRSADGTAKRTISELAGYRSLLLHYSPVSMVARGDVTLVGNSQIKNTSTNTNILAGGEIEISGGGSTVTATGTSSDNSHLGGDVTQYNSSIANTSLSSFFSNFFGTSMTTVQTSVAHYYSYTSNTNYNSIVNGMNGTSFWFEQVGSTTGTIDSTTQVGTPSQPVLLIVNGNLNLAGNAIVYGYIYVTGNLQTGGNVSVIGGIAVGGSVKDAGNYVLTYNASVLNNLQNLSGSYSVIPGSWNDLQKG